MKRKRLLIPAVLSILLLIPNFINYNINEDNSKITIHEKFDPSLVRLNTLNKLEQYTDSLALVKHITPGSMDYALIANEVVMQRFYYKYATQDLNENWIASLAQKVTGLFLSSKITADDILTKPYGYCGQQNTVLMELLQRKKLDCRVLYAPHHFAIQSYIEAKWCYFDATGEPDITVEQRSNEKWLYNIDSLLPAYKNNVKWINAFGNPVTLKLGKVNEIQGPHAQLFQCITKVLSRIAFLFPLVWYVSLKRKQQSATNNSQQTTQRWYNHFYGNERSRRRA